MMRGNFSLSADPDPRTRHTFWTGAIAAYFSWIPLFAGAQAQIQRYLAVPSEVKAKQYVTFIKCHWITQKMFLSS